MRVLIILSIFLISFFAFEFNRATSLETNPFFKIASDSMSPILRIGDIVKVCNNTNDTSFENLRIGDIIAFKASASDPGEEEHKTIVSRVAAIFEKGDLLAENIELNGLCYPIPLPNNEIKSKIILTKGDANECSIPGVDIPITDTNYIGKVVAINTDQSNVAVRDTCA